MTSIDLPAFVGLDTTPRWLKDVIRFLPLRSQFVLSGNARDRFPFPLGDHRFLALALIPFLTDSLRLAGFDHFVVFNSVHGFSAIAPTGTPNKSTCEFLEQTGGFRLNESGHAPCSLDRAFDVIDKLVTCQNHHVAVFADFASRYLVRPDHLDPHEHECFVKALLLSHAAKSHITERTPAPMFNPLFWICDREHDLPEWLTLGNPRIRAIVLPRPDHLLRRTLIDSLAPCLPGFETTPKDLRTRNFERFVEQTEGMMLSDVVSITDLSRREHLGFGEIEEAVRRYKLGVTEDPWKRLNREKIANGQAQIACRVKGQQPAVTKALDIIKRAVTGLTGAHGSKAGGKPRGVMFLAGPTGTGKTELAKTLTELLFGDEHACIRFDMSEFSAEHADQRLMGAPPGYVGYDSGGELTNAIKERPFAVVLFDEIEKAHPRILDKFLQLLDDGVLTSGRGERVYFSEAVIVFTSNLGIYRTAADGRRELNVRAEDPFQEVERKVRLEIERYFKEHLNRPELLNRIGENIVVFDFIRPEVAAQIFDKMLGNVLERLNERQRIRVELSPPVMEELRKRCISDLANGGRGIGNQLEAWLINPLARALFDEGVEEGAAATIGSIAEIGGVPVIHLISSGAPS